MVHLLVLTIIGGMTLCHNVIATNKYNFYADFDMEGIKGIVLFQQADDLTPVLIKLQMSTLTSLAWGIHQFPFINGEKESSTCSGIGEVIEHGDLTLSHGKFGYKSSYIDSNLRLTGSKTLLGRSLAIYNENGTVRACANILEFMSTMHYASATLHGSICGKVSILHSSRKPNSPAIIIAELFYGDGTETSTNGHNWYIGSNGVQSYENCSSVGSILGGPSSPDTCRPQAQHACAVGDLTGKHGTISVGIAGNKVAKKTFRFVDYNLRVSPPGSVVSKGLVVFRNGKPAACGDFITKGPIIAEASFFAEQHNGVSGNILFRQSTPYHATKISVGLEGLHNQAANYRIHEYPIPNPKPVTNICSSETVGEIFNPQGVKIDPFLLPQEAGSSDFFPVGDISGKFGGLAGQDSAHANFSDHQLSLYGRNSVIGRALVLYSSDITQSRWICANILPKDAVQLIARADFNDSLDLNGYIIMAQYIQTNGVLTSTGITIALDYKDGVTKTTGHNWHIHIDPVGNDSKEDISTRCNSVKGHYNPYKVNATGDYSSQCSPEYHLRCEVGDISSRQESCSIGDGKRYFYDEDITLIDATTVIGRSITIHEKNGGHGRLVCATISPGDIVPQPTLKGAKSS